MYLEEQFTMYKIANHLVQNSQYEVLHINDKDEEIWLEKYENKTSRLIRIAHQGFDWKNHLKKDIAHVFQKAKAMSRLLIGKNIELHNVYIAAHPPVDDWEVLKKPMQLKEKNPIKMKIYYLAEDEFTEEETRFYEAVGSTSPKTAEDVPESVMEEKVQFYKKSLTEAQQSKQKEVENIFSFGKPFLIYLLLIVNVFMFFLLERNGDSQSIENLIEFGAKYNPAIIERGEWWRVISSMFLHIGFLHLFMNMLAVYYLGSLVERIYGSWRFLIIYFLAGIGGGLASFAFSSHVSAGASGALFGLFGALLFFGVIHKKVFFQTMGKNILLLIGINIVFGFTIPQIDMGAHLGGLIAGFIASAIIHLPSNKDLPKQLIAFAVYLVMIVGLVIFGIENNMNSQAYNLMKIEELNQENKYEEVVDIATTALDKRGDLEGPLLFQRSYAYIELDQIDLAIEDLEKSIQSDNEIPEAYYNLALLYFNTGETVKAEEAIIKAYEMKPEDEGFINLYEQITGEEVQ
ncbi:rhomboid family intramembrane serine protease [Virgibacillus profundi]|uniref:Rhomboid family intramembrane serine protease n=1 Tax=Virgibacillus profundi TaxID=2024555 RepID=A0A2A2IDB5_9BACI|nr:rhomboid family intramembrane serine protease [Virgibacillus profundi]PAV29063.1 rhomboid family intramembrane serine protease [Virgibacillus profundi]PXY53232.1 rhomboid family intramembrane serine protease [Virgibacillus profundi]